MAETPGTDLDAKLAIERTLIGSVRGLTRRVAREIRVALAGGSPPPDVALLAQPSLEDRLKRHFRLCLAVFGTNLTDQLRADLRPGELERRFIEIETLRILDARAESQSRRIARSMENIASRAFRNANVQAAYGEKLDQGDVPQLTATLFLSGTAGQVRAISTTETQMGVETVKGIEAAMLLGGSTHEIKSAKPTPKAQKVWRSQGDSRVRGADGPSKFDHLAADGQSVDHDGAFDVGGELLLWPGDISMGASVGNIINCRCSAIYDSVGFAQLRVDYVGRLFEDVLVPFTPTESEIIVGVPLGTSTETIIPQASASSTLDMYQYADGEFLPGRAALHDDIMGGLKAEAVPQKKPVFHMMGGGSGAGKSSVINSGLADIPKNRVFIDADGIKGKLPEFNQLIAANDPKAAAFAHEESSLLAKRAMKEGAGESMNVVLDGTGNNGWESISKKLKLFREKGYAINADYVTIPTDTAVERATQRAARSGRVVPEENIRALHRSVSADFKEAVDRGVFDEVTLWNNDVPQGDPPFKIFSMKDGVQTVHDEDLWKKFLAKANE